MDWDATEEGVVGTFFWCGVFVLSLSVVGLIAFRFCFAGLESGPLWQDESGGPRGLVRSRDCDGVAGRSRLVWEKRTAGSSFVLSRLSESAG
jgi:hypothetical protein